MTVTYTNTDEVREVLNYFQIFLTFVEKYLKEMLAYGLLKWFGDFSEIADE